jgi:hypothetical protein
MPTASQIARSGTEDSLQAAYFSELSKYSKQTGYELLHWVHSIPNGGTRAQSVASMLKATGVKSGVWDVHLPWAADPYVGCYIEFKKANRINEKHGGLSDTQVEFGKAALQGGYLLYVCYDWEDALTKTFEYFERRTPKKGTIIPISW